jgi:N-acetylmuramoyl-L-alanine amidase
MKNILFPLILFAALQLSAQTQIKSTSYWLGKSNSQFTSLADGLGNDRLGGTKMGYIDSNVVFKVIDSVQNMYVVQLSKYHTAFISKNFIQKDSSYKEKKFYLTTSVIAKGTTGGYDSVAIRLDENLPYKSWMEINPSKIILNIYGVQANTNWITQLSTLKEVKNIYFNQIEDDIVQFTIELKHKQHWGYSLSYHNKILLLKVKQQPEELQLSKLTIAIDAGHGGTNLGADGVVSKALEKNYTLKFAEKLQHLLKKKGVKNIVMTRTKDTSLSMPERILFLQQHHPDVMISLHLNSSDNPSVSGTATFYKHIGFRSLSQALIKRMTELNLNEFGNVGNFNFALNNPTDFVNALVEIAFLSNVNDERKILDAHFQKQVAYKIYKGLNDWLKTIKKDKPKN